MFGSWNNYELTSRFQSQVKAEEIPGITLVDVSDDGEEHEENSMSQTSFAESWQMGEGDASTTMATEDDEVLGGSVGNKEGGTSSGTQGRQGKIQSFKP